MAWVGFRTLRLLAVLADFDEAPPEKVLGSVPTRGLALVGLAAGALCTAPLFFALPRLHGPYAVAPFRIGDAFSSALAADRVDLERLRCGQAQRPGHPASLGGAGPAPRRRAAAARGGFRGVPATASGSGTRRSAARRGQGSAYGGGPEAVATVVSVDLNVVRPGIPVSAVRHLGACDWKKDGPSELTDGVLRVSSGRGTVRYNVDVRRGPGAGPGARPDLAVGSAGRGPAIRAAADGRPDRPARDLPGASRSICSRTSSTRSTRPRRTAIPSSTSCCARGRATASTSRRPRR